MLKNVSVLTASTFLVDFSQGLHEGSIVNISIWKWSVMKYVHKSWIIDIFISLAGKAFAFVRDSCS